MECGLRYAIVSPTKYKMNDCTCRCNVLSRDTCIYNVSRKEIDEYNVCIISLIENLYTAVLFHLQYIHISTTTSTHRATYTLFIAGILKMI